MDRAKKPAGIVRVHYVFPPKGKETSPFQVTLEQVKKYASSRPLRRGPERREGTGVNDGGEKTDPRPEADKPNDAGMP